MTHVRSSRRGLRTRLSSIATVLIVATPLWSSSVVDAFVVGGSTKVGVGGPCAFTATDENTQFTNLVCTALNLTGNGGIVVLLEPAGEPDDSSIHNAALLLAIGLPSAPNVSDVFAMSTLAGCQLCVSFVSDGAPDVQFDSLANAINNNTFPRRFNIITENGTMQDVSAFFGQNPGVVQVGSDVPEPSTWLLTILPLTLLAYRRAGLSKSRWTGRN